MTDVFISLASCHQVRKAAFQSIDLLFLQIRASDGTSAVFGGAAFHLIEAGARLWYGTGGPSLDQMIKFSHWIEAGARLRSDRGGPASIK